MILNTLIEKFTADEAGAVTVDLVVLTAAIVGLGVAVTAPVSDGLSEQSVKIENQLTSQTVSTSFQ